MEGQVRSIYVAYTSSSSRPYTDFLKGSYYANIVVNESFVSDSQREAYPEYYGVNICECVVNPAVHADL
jgi:hypothetical protein